MNSINRIEAGSTSTPAVAPKAQGVNKLALATALFAGMATAACGEKAEKECQEEPGEHFLSEGTATNPSKDSFTYLSSYKFEKSPICIETRPGDGMYVIGKVNAIGTEFPKRNNDSRDPLVEVAPVDPLKPPVPFSETFYTEASELIVEEGKYGVLPWYMDQSPRYNNSESLSPQSISFCLLLDNPGAVGSEGREARIEKLRLDECTEAINM